MTTKMTLNEWMKEHGVSQAALGAMLSPPVLQNHVSKWLLGSVRVTLEQALQIQRITNGVITPADCADLHNLSVFSKRVEDET